MSDYLAHLLAAVARNAANETAPPADRASERLLDAAVREAGAVGLARVTVEEVVRRAGVARMTAYRRFPKRDDLVAALVQREVGRFLSAVAKSIEGTETTAEGVVASFAGAVAFARAHPMLRRAGEEPGEFMATVAANEAQVLKLGTGFIASYLHGSLPGDPSQEELWVAEAFARLFLTYVSIPPTAPDFADEAAVRRFAETVLAPMAQRVIDASAAAAEAAADGQA